MDDTTQVWSESHAPQASRSPQHTDSPVRHMAPYIYQPLEHEDSIRLLEIARWSPFTSLSCRIVQARRNTASYEALSYVWGAPILSKWLYEEGTKTHIPITENLDDALHRLSCQMNGALWRVWVDAVCIDQSSLKERNHQVKIMSSIYSRATNVLVWLGPVECGLAFSTLKEIASCSEAVGKATSSLVASEEGEEADTLHTLGFIDAGEKESDLADAVCRLRDTLRRCDIVNLGRLFASTWFTRVWVLQEFLLAGTLVIYMGENSILYTTFASSLHALKEHQELLPNKQQTAGFEFEHDYLRNFELVYGMFQARAVRRANCIDEPIGAHMLRSRVRLPTMSLYQWCHLLVQRKCTDERDRVYAALGLTPRPLAIIPDYSLSFADVRLDMARRSLLAGDFSVLHNADTPTSDASRTSRLSFVPSLRPDLCQDRPLPLGGFGVPRYSAGLARSPNVLTSSPKSVSIQGIGVGEIIYINTFADALNDIAIGRGNFFKPQLHDAYSEFRSSYVTNCRFEDMKSLNTYIKLAFWQTINLGFVPERSDTVYFQKGLDFRFLDYPYRQNIKRCFKNRIFFVTQEGSMGLGPKWLKEQDKIVVFDGAETPFILRRTTDEVVGEAWLLMGDCYLHGWMVGSYLERKIKNNTEAMMPTFKSEFFTATEQDDITRDNGVTTMMPTFKSELFTLC
jgi:hypothetical protein